MRDIESVVTAFAKGLMQAILEAGGEDSRACHAQETPRKGRSRKKAASALSEVAEAIPDEVIADELNGLSMELQEAYRQHQERRALVETPAQPEIDLEQVFIASKLAQEEAEMMAKIHAGPGEDENQNWAGVQ